MVPPIVAPVTVWSLTVTASTEAHAAHRFVWLVALRHKVWTFEIYIHSGLNSNLKHMLQYTAQFKKKCCRKVFPEWVFPPRLSRINAWSEANLLSLYLGNIQCWYFLKIRYEITILIITCRYKIFHYENIMSLSAIHSQVWYASRDLHPRNITMSGNNTSPDVNTSPNQCLESIAISFAHANWSSMGTRSSNDLQKPDHMTGTRIAAPDKQERQGRLHVKLSCLSEHVRM